MSPEERQLLTALFDRIRTATGTPRDADAERLIADAVRAEPSAPYYLAQAVIVQEKGLEAASKRITELEATVRDLEANAARPTAPAEERGGFLSSIFGSSQPPRPAQAAPMRPAPPQVAQAPQAGPWGQQAPVYAPQQPAYAPQQPTGPWSQPAPVASAGSSFLTGALGTAAGVAGGMLLAHSLSGVFGNHMSGLGLGSPAAEGFGTAPVEETVINNYYGDSANPSPQNEPTPIDANTDTSPAAADDNGFQQADLDTDDGGWNDDSSDFGSDDSGTFA